MAGNFVIRELMNECADAWNGGAEPISPFMAAAQFSSELHRRRIRYDTYLQTIITGGGHVHDPLLTKETAVERNIENALKVGEMLDDEGIVDLNSSVEAAAMPTIDGWEPDDWMTFWPLIISKPNFQKMSVNRLSYLESEFQLKVQERVNYGGLDMDKYRDRSIKKSERIMHYSMHINAMHELLANRNLVETNPVWRIIGLLGIEESVGATTEKFYATNLGIRAFQAVLANVEPLAPEQLSDQKLAGDITRLRQLGVQALAGTPTQKFILVENRTPTSFEIPEY